MDKSNEETPKLGSNEAQEEEDDTVQSTDKKEEEQKAVGGEESSTAGQRAPLPADECRDAPAEDTAAAEQEEEAEEEEEEEEEEAEEQLTGIPISNLLTVKQMWLNGEFERVAPKDEAHPHNDLLNKKVVVWRGDITTLRVDGIVNAANSSLLGGGGVDGAIHRAAGRGLYRECKTLNGASTGESKITGGHLLPAKHVIHTVGPIYHAKKRVVAEQELRSCYRSALELTVANGLTSLAFSGISTGVYGYPLDDATRVALDVVRQFLETPDGEKLEKIIFTVFRQIDVDSYFDIIPEFFPPAPLPSKNPAPSDPSATSTPAAATPGVETQAKSDDVPVEAPVVEGQEPVLLVTPVGNAQEGKKEQVD